MCECGEMFTLIGGTILECEACFSRNMAEFTMETLILKASLGIMSVPITQGRMVRV